MAGLHFTYPNDKKAASQAATPAGSQHLQHSSSDASSDKQAFRTSDTGIRGPLRDSASSNRPLKETYSVDDVNLESQQEVVCLSCLHVGFDLVVCCYKLQPAY